MLDAVSESDPRRRTQRSSSRLRTPLPPSLSPSASVDSDRSPLSSLFSSLPLWREGGMAHASTSAAAAAYAPSITNVNSQDGSLSHWLRRRRHRCSIALSLLVERGREGSAEVAPVAVVPRNGDSRIDREGARPRRGLPRSPLPSSSSSSSLHSLLPPLACSLLPPPPPSSERSLSSRPFFSSHAEKGRSKQ